MDKVVPNICTFLVNVCLCVSTQLCVILSVTPHDFCVCTCSEHVLILKTSRSLVRISPATFRGELSASERHSEALEVHFHLSLAKFSTKLQRAVGIKMLAGCLFDCLVEVDKFAFVRLDLDGSVPFNCFSYRVCWITVTLLWLTEPAVMLLDTHTHAFPVSHSLQVLTASVKKRVSYD